MPAFPILGGPAVEGDPGDLNIAPASLGTSREPVIPAFIVWGLDDIAGPFGEQRFDAVLSEDHERTTVVTEHSVEQGSNIVDHVRPNVNKLLLEVFVSNTPVYSTDAEVGPMTLDIPQPGQGGLFAFFNGGTSALLDKGLQFVGLQRGYPTHLTANVMRFSGEADYVKNCLDTLTRLRDTATLLSIRTPRQHYTDMILETIRMSRSPQTGSSGAAFQLEFRQIRIVSSKIVAAPQPSIKAAAPTQPKGKQDTKPPERADKESVAHYIQRTGLSPAAAAKALGLPL